MIRFEKEYWRLGDHGKVHHFSTFGYDYSKGELVKRLNELENENARLSFELWRLRSIKTNLELIRDDIESIERLEDKDKTITNMVKALLEKEV